MGLGRYAFVLVIGGAGAGMACADTSHVYEGRRFTEERGCLEPTTSLDVVEGERAGNCVPKCLVHPQADGGRTVYVSRMCGPFPFGFDLTGTDPSCAAALAALSRGDGCLADGGSSAPLPADGGSD